MHHLIISLLLNTLEIQEEALLENVTKTHSMDIHL